MNVPVVDKNAKLKIEDVPIITEEVSLSEKKSRVIFGIGTVLGLLIVGSTIVLGYFYINKPVVVTEMKTVETTPLPTAIPTVGLNKSEITFEVQNGTGTAGVGAKNKTKLESLGYTVVVVGNASGKHTGIELYLKSAENKDLIMEDLKTDFVEVDYVGELKDSTASARLIIGK